MRLIDDQQCVGGQIVIQRRWGRTGRTTGQVARVVFDTVAVTQLHDHFQVKAGTLLKTLSLHELVLTAQVIEPLAQLVLDLLDGVEQRLPRGHVVTLGVEGEARELADHLAGQRIEG